MFLFLFFVSHMLVIFTVRGIVSVFDLALKSPFLEYYISNCIALYRV